MDDMEVDAVRVVAPNNIVPFFVKFIWHNIPVWFGLLSDI